MEVLEDCVENGNYDDRATVGESPKVQIWTFKFLKEILWLFMLIKDIFRYIKDECIWRVNVTQRQHNLVAN